MSWKASAILIRPIDDPDYEDILRKLNIGKIEKAENATFNEALHTTRTNLCFLGSLNKVLIICADILPLTFIKPHVPEKEKILMDMFPDSEICALQLHGGVGYFAMSISIGSQKTRVLSGTQDGLDLNIGEPIRQEIEIFSNNGEAACGQTPNESFYIDRGEDIIFSMFRKYLGFNIEQSSIESEMLFSMEFKGYSFDTTDKSWFR